MRQIGEYIRRHRMWFIVPLALIVLVVVGLALLSQGDAVGPRVYPRF